MRLSDIERDTVMGSTTVYNSVFVSNRDLVWYLVWNNVNDSVMNLVNRSIRASVRTSVMNSVYNLIYDSIGGIDEVE